MPVMEIFGPTIQGEGMVIGRKTVFVRTGGCDYSCSWCDSSFTWNGEEKAALLTPEAVFNAIMKLIEEKEEGRIRRNADHVTITGGNPALIGPAMGELIAMLHEAHMRVGLETQGSRWQSWFVHVDDLTISPKPPSSGMKTDWNILDSIIARLDQWGTVTGKKVNYSLKVVVFDDADFKFAKKVHQRYPGVDFYVSVGNDNSKEDGDISGRLLRKLDWLWDKVLKDPECNTWKPLPQLHTLVWHNKRGV